jgi:Rrf2 family protein
MKLSTRSRYGLRLLMELASRETDKPVFLSDIAESQNISEKYLSKLVIPLRSAGLLDSVRGASGGYVLNKRPEDITLWNVVQALEGGISLVDCVDNSRVCDRATTCPARRTWGGLERAMKEYCEGLTLADILKEGPSAGFAENI